MRPSKIQSTVLDLVNANLVPMVLGPPGCGKTASISQAVEESGHETMWLHPISMRPSDIQGIGFVVDGRAEFLPYGFMRKMVEFSPREDGQKLVVIIDDAFQANDSVQKVLQQLILHRGVGDLFVSEHVRFVMISNRLSDKAGVRTILSTCTSRAIPLSFDVNLDDWMKWAAKHDIHPLIQGFLRNQRDMLYKGEPTNTGEPWASPRGWEFCSRGMMATPPDCHMAIAVGSVGEAVGTNFMGFAKTADKMVPTADIFKNPKGVPIPDKNDKDFVPVMWATLGSINSVMQQVHEKAPKIISETVKRYFDYVERLPVEFQAVAIRDGIESTPNCITHDSENRYRNWMTKHQNQCWETW